jgi:hypothetical protein
MLDTPSVRAVQPLGMFTSQKVKLSGSTNSAGLVVGEDESTECDIPFDNGGLLLLLLNPKVLQGISVVAGNFMTCPLTRFVTPNRVLSMEKQDSHVSHRPPKIPQAFPSSAPQNRPFLVF